MRHGSDGEKKKRRGKKCKKKKYGRRVSEKQTKTLWMKIAILNLTAAYFKREMEVFMNGTRLWRKTKYILMWDRYIHINDSNNKEC